MSSGILAVFSRVPAALSSFSHQDIASCSQGLALCKRMQAAPGVCPGISAPCALTPTEGHGLYLIFILLKLLAV